MEPPSSRPRGLTATWAPIHLRMEQKLDLEDRLRVVLQRHKENLRNQLAKGVEAVVVEDSPMLDVVDKEYDCNQQAKELVDIVLSILEGRIWHRRR